MKTRFDSSLDRLAEYSEKALLAELRRTAKQLGKSQLTIRDIDAYARCSYATLKQRFGGLTNALNAAGLDGGSFNRNVSDEDLLDELERIWERTLTRDGRRPYKRDLDRYNGKFSQGPYYRRWGSWIRACEAVLERSDKSEQSYEINSRVKMTPGSERRQRQSTKRRIPLRVRYNVLRRDRFVCTVCGRSPATHPGTILHVDHIFPESKGGTSEVDNLRTLCAECNLGKGAS